MPSLRSMATVCAAITALAVAGCGADDDASTPASANAAIKVAATTPQAADFARQVGGDRVIVRALVPANADPHDFEPRPSDAQAIVDADVVVRSGGDIDGWLDDLVENAGGDADVVDLIDAVRTREGGHADDEHAAEAGHAEEGEHAEEDGHAGEELDPHWWQDPRNVERAVERLRAAFVGADPAGAKAYAANTRRYVSQLRRLDRDVASCMSAIPADRRKLVTNHDAFGYFAGRYDIEVLGAIVPSLSTTAQASAGDVRRLVATIRREGVTTIFPEQALSRRLERAVARDAGVEVGPPLYADTLGPGSDGSYLEALRHDAAAMARGFGQRCSWDRGGA